MPSVFVSTWHQAPGILCPLVRKQPLEMGRYRCSHSNSKRLREHGSEPVAEMGCSVLKQDCSALKQLFT